MKLKYYLRGLGVGIIVTTILLMISFAKHGTMSDKQVMKRAEELGMVMQETESIDEPTSENTVSESTQETETQKDTQNEPDTQQAPVEPQQPAESQQPQMIDIRVEKGEYCREISEKLAAEGLVDNAEAFRKYMGEIQYDEMVTIGVYHIPVGASYEEIANILISGNE